MEYNRRLMKTHPTQTGFTLIECLIAITILVWSVMAMTVAVTSAQSQMQQLRHSQQAIMLAEELMERVNALPYNDPNGIVTTGPDGGLINNMDDYDGFTQAAGQLKNLTGTLYPSEFQTFSRTVSAKYGTISLTGLGTVNCLNVTVTVTDAHGATWRLTSCIPQPPS